MGNACFPGGSDSKESASKAVRQGFDPWVWKIPWRRAWLPTPVFLPGEYHGRRSLSGYSPRGLKESDQATEHACNAKMNPTAKTQTLLILCIHPEGLVSTPLWMLQMSAISSERQVEVEGWGFGGQTQNQLLRVKRPVGSCFHA